VSIFILPIIPRGNVSVSRFLFSLSSREEMCPLAAFQEETARFLHFPMYSCHIHTQLDLWGLISLSVWQVENIHIRILKFLDWKNTHILIYFVKRPFPREKWPFKSAKWTLRRTSIENIHIDWKYPYRLKTSILIENIHIDWKHPYRLKTSLSIGNFLLRFIKGEEQIQTLWLAHFCEIFSKSVFDWLNVTWF
jgi:hypothetical protein